MYRHFNKEPFSLKDILISKRHFSKSRRTSYNEFPFANVYYLHLWASSTFPRELYLPSDPSFSKVKENQFERYVTKKHSRFSVHSKEFCVLNSSSIAKQTSNTLVSPNDAILHRQKFPLPVINNSGCMLSLNRGIFKYDSVTLTCHCSANFNKILMWCRV